MRNRCWSVALVAVSCCLQLFAGQVSGQSVNDIAGLVQRYDALSAAGKFREAQPLAQQILTISERTYAATSHEIATALNRLAESYRELGQYDQAVPLYQRALKIREQRFGREHTSVAVILNNLGLCYGSQGNHADAEKLHNRALAIREKQLGRDHEYVALTLSNLGLVYFSQARYAEAEQAFSRSLEIRERKFGPTHADVAMSLNNLGLVFAKQGRYAKSEPLQKRALAIWEKTLGPEHINIALALNNLGVQYDESGHYAEAEQALKRALRIREKTLGPDHLQVAYTKNNLANVYFHQKRWRDAEPLFIQAINANFKSVGLKHPGLATMLSNLGLVYLNLANYEKAEMFLKKSHILRMELLGAEHPDIALSLNNLATLGMAQQHYDEARDALTRSLALSRKTYGPEHSLVSITLENLALANYRLKRVEEAEALFVENQALQKKIVVPDSTLAETYLNLAAIRWETDRRAEALADLDRALELYESQRATFSGSEHDRATVFGTYSYAYEVGILWQSEAADTAKAFSTSERMRGRSLVEQMKVQGVDLFAGMPPAQATALRQREADNATLVARLEKEVLAAQQQTKLDKAEQGKLIDKLQAQLRSARKEAIEIYRDIRGASPAWRLMVSTDFKPLALEEVQEWIDKDEALLLEYYIGNAHSFLFVVAAGAEPKVIKLQISADDAKTLGVEAGELTVKKLRTLMSLGGKPLAEVFKDPAIKEAANTAKLNARLHWLWKLLVPEETRQALVEGKFKRLIVAPDGPLVNLPLDALVVEQNDDGVKYLLDVGPPIVSGPSATLLYNLSMRQRNKPAAGGQAVLTVGDPTYAAVELPKANSGDVVASQSPRARFSTRSALKPLPYSGLEANWVADQFNPVGLPTSTLTKGQATEQAVRSRLAGRQIVHFACHGLCDQSYGNLFGALAIAPGNDAAQNPADDGFLTLGEIYGLNLQGCELAILSACETNLGPQQQGEGVFALSRGFLVAGARRVIASNWVVDDESSASLVSVLCSVLAKQHKAGQAMDHAQALHEAKRWARKHDKWSHPYYWGAFILVGPN